MENRNTYIFIFCIVSESRQSFKRVSSITFEANSRHHGGSFSMRGPRQLHRELLFECKSNCFHKIYPMFHLNHSGVRR